MLDGQPNPKFEEVIRYSKDPSSRFWLFYHACHLEAFGRTAPFGRLPEEKEQASALAPLIQELTQVLRDRGFGLQASVEGNLRPVRVEVVNQPTVDPASRTNALLGGELLQ